MDRRQLRKAVLTVALCAGAFQGCRGLWEPDEGRYQAVAQEMLDSGDFWVPRLHGQTYLDKPPLLYWGIAAGQMMLGNNEWGARLFHALAFLLTALLVGDLATRMWGPEARSLAVLAYGSCLLPGLAAFALTPDTLLALTTTACLNFYWRWFTSDPSSRWRWAVLLGVAGGLGILAKGPALFVFAAPLVLHVLWSKGLLGTLRRLELWVSFAISLTVGLTWYVFVSAEVPGALSYFLDNQVTGRLISDHYQRNAEWWGPLVVYLPALAIGALPVLVCWRLVSAKTATQAPVMTPATTQRRLLALQIFFPLVVLCAASSRLPFYALPLVAPIVVAGAGRWHADDLSVRRVLVAGAVVVVAVKGGLAGYSSNADTGALARALSERGVRFESEIVAVGHKRHALPFYGYSNLTWAPVREYPIFVPPPLWEQARAAFESVEHETVFLAKWDLSSELQQIGLQCGELEAFGRTRIWRCHGRRPQQLARARVGEAGHR